jgi:hypothetical protein
VTGTILPFSDTSALYTHVVSYTAILSMWDIIFPTAVSPLHINIVSSMSHCLSYQILESEDCLVCALIDSLSYLPMIGGGVHPHYDTIAIYLHQLLHYYIILTLYSVI